MVSSFSDPVKYYNPDIKINDIKGDISGKEISVIPYGEEIHGINHQQILTTAGYKKKTETDYREVTIETWQKI
jgi:hypothetical protein